MKKVLLISSMAVIVLVTGAGNALAANWTATSTDPNSPSSFNNVHADSFYTTGNPYKYSEMTAGTASSSNHIFKVADWAGSGGGVATFSGGTFTHNTVQLGNFGGIGTIIITNTAVLNYYNGSGDSWWQIGGNGWTSKKAVGTVRIYPGTTLNGFRMYLPIHNPGASYKQPEGYVYQYGGDVTMESAMVAPGPGYGAYTISGGMLYCGWGLFVGPSSPVNSTSLFHVVGSSATIDLNWHFSSGPRATLRFTLDPGGVSPIQIRNAHPSDFARVEGSTIDMEFESESVRDTLVALPPGDAGRVFNLVGATGSVFSAAWLYTNLTLAAGDDTDWVLQDDGVTWLQARFITEPPPPPSGMLFFVK